MVRKHVKILIVAVTAVVAISWFLRTEEGTRQTQVEVGSDQDRAVPSIRSEEELGLLAQKSKLPTTQIPTHGQNAATESRKLLAPRSKPVTLPKPDDRSLAQSSVLSGTSWKVWEGVTAYPQASGVRSDYLAEVSGYYLVEEETFRGDDRHFSSAQPLAVYNERKGIAGIVTGTIQIILNEGESIDSLVQEYDLKVMGSMPEAKVYFVTSAQEPFNLSSLKERLSSEPVVKQVELEILSRKYEKF